MVPKDVDTEFLSAFNRFIREQTEKYKRRFFIVVGGGGPTRHYQEAARIVRGTEIEDTDLDWLGIHSSRLNAQLVRTVFKEIADPRVIKHYEIILKIDKPVAVAAGWKPGWSTDYCAVTLAEDYRIPTVINLTNIAQVYDKDPKTHPEAKPLKDIDWPTYRAMVGDTWRPGMNAPFDPIASKLAEANGITVKILDGHNFEALANALDDKDFVGTTIHP